MGRGDEPGVERRAALPAAAGRGRRGARRDPRSPAREGPHGLHVGDRDACDAGRPRRAAARARARRRRADAARRRHGADRAAGAGAAGDRGAPGEERRRAPRGRADRGDRLRRPGPDGARRPADPDPDNVVYVAYVDGEPVARASAAFSEHGVSLFGGSTLPEARGQGRLPRARRGALARRGRARHPGARHAGLADVAPDPRAARLPRGLRDPDPARPVRQRRRRAGQNGA